MAKYRSKVFFAEDFHVLETQVNDFLESEGDSILKIKKVNHMSYAISEDPHHINFSAMIVFTIKRRYVQNSPVIINN